MNRVSETHFCTCRNPNRLRMGVISDLEKPNGAGEMRFYKPLKLNRARRDAALGLENSNGVEETCLCKAPNF